MIIYFITKYKPYRYYVAYSILLIIYQGSYFGYFHLLTNLSVQFIYSAMIISSIGFIIALVYFLRELFSFEKRLEHLFSLLVFVLVIGMFGILLGYWLHLHYYVELFFNLINLTMPIYVVLVLYSLYSLFFKEKNYLALWYAIGWSIVAFSGLLLILTQVNIISTKYGIEYFFEITMMVESLLLAIFLAYRIKEIEQEKQTQKILLLRQNRLASMGEMVNMIAHQWRQPLAEINGVVMNLDLDYRTQELNDQSFELYLSEIEGITHYLSKTISDFMNFFNTKKELEEFKLLDLFDELNGILLKCLSRVEFLAVFDRLLVIKSYRNELLQVLLIIINNAIDACLLYQPSSSRVLMDAKEDDNHIIISIENNGGVIDKKILDKIFDPYFSTKHQSKGTGLGLYILKIIVEQSMGGEVSIFNKDDGVVVLLTLHK